MDHLSISNLFDGIPTGDFTTNNTETCQYEDSLDTTSTTAVAAVPEDDGQQYDDHQNEEVALLILATYFPERSFMEIIPKKNNSAGSCTYKSEMIKK